MELSRTELSILSELAEKPRSISEVARLVGKSQPAASAAIGRLRRKGFVTVKRSGMRKLVEIGDAKHAQILKELMQTYHHVPWHSLLAYSQLMPLLGESIPPSVMSRVTQWRTMRSLMAHGIVIKDKNGIKLNPRFGRLAELGQEYWRFYNAKMATSLPHDAAIVWTSGPEFIVRVPGRTRITDKRFKPTATTVLPRYGIRLISKFDYYYYTPFRRKLRVEDIVLHTICIDGLANTLYAMILMAKTKPDTEYLRCHAERLGLHTKVDSILHLFATREASPGLPSWQELAEKARDYGVKI